MFSLLSAVTITTGVFASSEIIYHVTGDFDISQRYPPHRDFGHVKAGNRWDVEYHCIGPKAKKCMLPSYSTCFLTYVTEGAHCDVVYQGSADVFLSQKNGNCAVRCFLLPGLESTGTHNAGVVNFRQELLKVYKDNFVKMGDYGLAPVWSMDQISGDFSTDLRSKPHMQDCKADVHADEYFCQSQTAKRCMLPSYGTCFITYLTQHAHCDIMYNGSKDAMMSVKSGNCRVRCYQVNSPDGYKVNEVEQIGSMQQVTGSFDLSSRSKAHATKEHVLPMLHNTLADYACLTVRGSSKYCMLPSSSTCFLKYATEEAHCDIMYNGTPDVFVSAKDGNCAVNCFYFRDSHGSLMTRSLRRRLLSNEM